MDQSRDRPDGRTLRGERTREAVVEAFEALLVAEDGPPTAESVAERAGISTRSVYVHFTSLDELFSVVARRVMARVVDLVEPIDADGPIVRRIDEIARQRALIEEEIGPFRRASARQEGRYSTLDEVRDQRRLASLAQVERIFAAELDMVTGDERRRLVAMVDTVLSGATWDELRRGHGLGVDDATASIAGVVTRLLGPPPERVQ